jgi:hypothetical protein
MAAAAVTQAVAACPVQGLLLRQQRLHKVLLLLLL